MIKLYAKTKTTPAYNPGFTMTQDPALAGHIVALYDNVANLPAHQQDFAKSLINQYNGTKPLSAKQVWWVGELAAKATKPKPAPARPMKVGEEGALKGVFALFDTALKHLKHPKIRLMAGSQPIALQVATQGAHEGTIKVTDGNGGYGSAKWFGRVNKNGTWAPGKMDQATLVSVYSLLVAFADDPATVAATQGKLQAKCVFCAKKLTTDESLSVGYGKDCAAHYNLPWGGK